MRLSLLASLLTTSALACFGCAGDDGNGDDGSTPTSGAASSSTGGGGTTAAAEESTAAASEEGPGSSTGSAESTDEGVVDGSDGSSSTGPVNTCDPVVPGEWNACVVDGGVDNTLCNWMGQPGTNGFISCLNAPKNAGNTCIIEGCRDACDCFGPAPTGNAEVVCAETIKGGGTACVLSCANGETCPDAMECIGGTCFHPSAE